MRDFIFPMNLQLFAEGGAAAGGDGAGVGTGVSAPAAGVLTKGAKANPLANVVYGKQPTQAEEGVSAAGVQTEKPAEGQPVDRSAEFEKLIKGDYKAEYDKRVQDTIRQRLKGAKETEDRLASMNPLLDLLAARYGKEATDTQGIIKALESDDSFLEAAAAEKNMEPQHYRQMLKLQSENARLRNQTEEQFKQQQIQQQYAKWEQQAEQAKVKYPNLDLNVESENPQFRQLLLAGVDVGTAYAAIHNDEIISGAMQYATQNAKEMAAKTIAAGKARPAENGMQGQSSAVFKADPSKWSKQDREEVRKRVARGEKILL